MPLAGFVPSPTLVSGIILYDKKAAVNHSPKITIQDPECVIDNTESYDDECSCVVPFVLKDNNGKISFDNFLYADYVGVDVDTSKLDEDWHYDDMVNYFENKKYHVHAFPSLTEGHYKFLIRVDRIHNIADYKAMRDYTNHSIPFADKGYKGHQTYVKGYIGTIKGDVRPVAIQGDDNSNSITTRVHKENGTQAVKKQYNKRNSAECDYSKLTNELKKAILNKKVKIKGYEDNTITDVIYQKGNNSFTLCLSGEKKSVGSFFIRPYQSIMIFKGDKAWTPAEFMKDKKDNHAFYKILRIFSNADTRMLFLAGDLNINDFDNAIADMRGNKIIFRKRLTKCGIERKECRVDNKRISYFIYQGVKYYENSKDDVIKLCYRIKNKFIDVIKGLADKFLNSKKTAKYTLSSFINLFSIHNSIVNSFKSFKDINIFNTSYYKGTLANEDHRHEEMMNAIQLMRDQAKQLLCSEEKEEEKEVDYHERRQKALKEEAFQDRWRNGTEMTDDEELEWARDEAKRMREELGCV